MNLKGKIYYSKASFLPTTMLEASIVMSLLPIYGQNKIMSFSGEKGHYPTIQFGPQFELFYERYLRTNTHDFVKIPKTVIKDVLSKVIKVPKAFCLYLELTFLETKTFLKN